MAALGSLPVPCPACGDVIDVPVSVESEGMVGDQAHFLLGIDREPISQHIAQHAERGAE